MDMVLLSILACPLCGGKLLYDQQEQALLCRFDRLGFLIQAGIPLLKPNQAFMLKGDSH
jgi:uncharacterized protein